MSYTATIARNFPILAAVALAVQFNGGAGYQFYMLACLLVLGAFTYNLITNGKTFAAPGFDAPLVWLAAFVVWATLSITWSETVGTTALSLPRLYAGLLMGLTAYIVSARDFRFVLIGFQLLAFGLGLYTIYQGLALGVQRPSAFFVNWNTHAAFLNLILLPTAAWYLATQKKLVAGILIAIIAIASAMTLSRGAILGGAVGLLCLAFLGHKYIRRSALTGLILWIAGGYILGSILYEGAPLARLTQSLTGEYIASGRWVIWESSWNMYLRFPVLGWGLETFWQAYPAFRHPHDSSAGQNAHNEYLQFLLELGPVGLMLFICLLGSLIYRIYARRHTIGLEGSGLFAALAALGIQATFTSTYYHLAIWLVFGWYLGRLSFLTAAESGHMWSPLDWFTRKGFTTIILLAAAIPGAWLTALFMSELELKKLESSRNAGEFLRQLPQAEKYYNFRDVTQLLFAAQILSALVEQKAEIKVAERDAAIDAALLRLKHAAQLYPMRAENFRLRAELKQLAPERYAAPGVIADYQKALELDPALISTRLAFANYLENNGRSQMGAHVLKQGWNRHYYGPYQSVMAFITALKDAKYKTGSTEDMEDIIAVEKRINERYAKGFLVDHWFLGNSLVSG
jgi:O-antigen ligase